MPDKSAHKNGKPATTRQVDVATLAKKIKVERSDLIRKLADYDIVVQHGEIPDAEQVARIFGRTPIGNAVHA